MHILKCLRVYSIVIRLVR